MPLDIHKALQRSGIISVSARVADKPVLKGSSEAGGDTVISNEPGTTSVDDAETFPGKICDEKARGVLGSI